MEAMQDVDKDVLCVSCLSKSDERVLHSYNLQGAGLRSILKVDSLSLCYLCEYRAQKIELFIQNVQNNQIFLENIHNLASPSFQKFNSLQNFTCITLKPIELTGMDIEEEDTFTVLTNGSSCVKVKVEIELKGEEVVEESGAGFQDDVGDHDLDQYVKEEDEYPLQRLKEELDLEGINIKCLRKSTRKNKLKKKLKKEKVLKVTDIDKERDIKIETIRITKEQCMEERNKLVTDPKYVNAIFKCRYCIKGFIYEPSFKKHMEKHYMENGDHNCNICRQAFESLQRLQYHQRSHQIRYRCSHCGIVRANRAIMKEHARTHGGTEDFSGGNVCMQCKKTFRGPLSLRKHIAYAHRPRLRTRCQHCDKTYATKEGLRTHQMTKHPAQCSSSALLQQHVCQECGATFCAASRLKNHLICHTSGPGAYCVECDKLQPVPLEDQENVDSIDMTISAYFKTNSILQHHLKTARAHTQYLELPLACLHCDKRFAIRRDVERHTNRVHLNIKPYPCEKCDKAYINSWSLAEHKRITHEGYRRPLDFPCPMCDKVFDRKQILKGHMRTHTGERPYHCTNCPAQFSQSSILNTHIRLIHLRQTRDGRPKQRQLEHGK